MPFPTRSGSRAGTAGRECPAKNAETMISAVYYIFLVLLCTFFMILSALALVVCYPFDKGRRVCIWSSFSVCAARSRITTP